MTQEDTFLSRLKAPAPPGTVDDAVLAAAKEAAAGLKSGNSYEPKPVLAAKKSYDSPSQSKAGGGARESAMDNIVFPCPACGTKYSVPAQHAGKTTPCKKCGAQVTVPVPQVANPTIIGGTRTIRRADIEDASTSERAAPVMKKATAKVPKQARASTVEVDMKGGESVLRKEETVVSYPSPAPPTRGPASRVPPPPMRGAPRPVPGGRPAPLPGQPGYGAPKQKNQMPLYLGIGGGALVLVVIIIIIAVNSGSGGGTQGTKDGGPKDDNKDGSVVISDDERLLKQFETDTRNEIGLTTPAAQANYKQAKEKAKGGGKFADKFKEYKDQFAQLLAKRAEESTSKADVRDIALMLHTDGYQDLARPLIVKARGLMTDKDRFRTESYEVEIGGEKVKRDRRVPTEPYKQICDILGLIEYKFPETEFSEYFEWDLPEYMEWDMKKRALTEDEGRDVFLPKGEFDELMVLHNKLATAGQKLRDQDAKDNFAIAARKAFVRFKQRQTDTNKRAMFSPKALGREGEKFEQVWGYTYWRPFIVYVEIAPDRSVESLRKDFEAKANLLMQEERWFRTNIIEKFGLKRVLPLEGPTKIREGKHAGKSFDTPGELAEAEGWPLEINVLKDSQTFQLFLETQMGGGIPGARAFYSNPLKHVVTWDDPNASEGDDQAWFNESVLIHETFHMLTDHYAANPVDWDWEYGERDESGKRKKVWKPKSNKARLFNVFIQEGLTDSVAGFKKEGDEYHFLQGNRVRIREWYETYKALEKNNLLRIRDLLDCTHYGHFGPVGNRCWKRLGLDKKKGGYPNPNAYFGLYYATGCMASTFFYHCKENGSYKYREMWMNYVKMDYAGEVERGEYSPDPGIKAFKEAFGLKTDADFDKLEKEFVAWSVRLSEGEDLTDKDEIGDAPDLPPSEGFKPMDGERWAALREEAHA